MISYFSYLAFSIFVILLITNILAYLKKDQLKTMNRMIIAMALSMTLSLTLGILLGFIYIEDLYRSTLCAVITGVIISIFVGYLLGKIAILEGFFASIMGGMMGAMLGFMVEPQQALNLIQLFLAISFSCLFLFFILSSSKIKVTSHWVLKPILYALILIAYISIGNYLAEVYIEIQPSTPSHEHGNH